MTRKQAVEKSDFGEFGLGIEDMMDAASTGALEDEASCGTASNSAQRFGGWDGVCGNGKPNALVEPAPMSSRSVIVTPRRECSARAVPQSPSLHFDGINSGSRPGSSIDHEDVTKSLTTLSEAFCKLQRADKVTERLANMAMDANDSRHNPRFNRIFNDFLSTAKQTTNHMADVGYTLRYKKSYMTKGAVAKDELRQMFEKNRRYDGGFAHGCETCEGLGRRKKAKDG